MSGLLIFRVSSFAKSSISMDAFNMRVLSSVVYATSATRLC